VSPAGVIRKKKSPAEVIVGGGYEILQLGGSQEEVQKKPQLGTTQ
jgi:hypothetical protein